MAGKTRLVEAHPEKNEIVVAVLTDPGSVLRVHHPDGRTADYTPLNPGGPLVAAVVADKATAAFGAAEARHADVEGLTRHRHESDRNVWHAAAVEARRRGVVYVLRGDVKWRGRSREGAVSVRFAQ